MTNRDKLMEVLEEVKGNRRGVLEERMSVFTLISREDEKLNGLSIDAVTFGNIEDLGRSLHSILKQTPELLKALAKAAMVDEVRDKLKDMVKGVFSMDLDDLKNGKGLENMPDDLKEQLLDIMAHGPQDTEEPEEEAYFLTPGSGKTQ